jgi:hypothetical protein
VLGGAAVVTGPHITLEGVLQSQAAE